MHAPIRHAHALVLFLGLFLALAAVVAEARATAAWCDYRVVVDEQPAMVLEVHGQCSGTDAAPRFADFSAARFAKFATPPTAASFRYRFDLDAFVAASGNFRQASRRGDARMATLASWLAAPAVPGVGLRITVDAAPGRFATALPRQGEAHVLDAGALPRAGYTLFGDLPRQVLTVDGGAAVIEVVDLRAHGQPPLGWIADTATEVARYYGRFPVSRLLLVLLGGDGDGIDYGRVVGGGGATMLLVIGEGASEASLYDEWVLVHEMLHLGAPFLVDGFWFMEGFATYAEPILRARAGWRSERSVWREFHRDMPRGLAAMREGLARTRAGMYWGGALFMLLADRGYRAAGVGGLDHCMRAVLDELGDTTVALGVDRVIDHCDQVLGVPVMRTLADRYVARGSALDLDALWRELGVQGTADGVVLDDRAVAAALRRDIVRRSADGEQALDDDAPDLAR